MITAALMWPTADLLSQSFSIESRLLNNDAGYDDNNNNEVEEKTSYDLGRTAQMAFYGTFVSAPIYTFWYTYLDNFSHKLFSGTTLPSILKKVTSAASMRSWQIITFKLLTDAFIFDPLYLLIFFSTTNLIEGKNITEVVNEIKAKLFKTYLIDITVWTPVQYLNFRYIPVLYQALVVQFGNLFWNSYLSYTQHKFIDNKKDD